MAVTRKGQIIKLGAASDAVTGKMRIQAITLEHSAAANVVLVDTANQPVAQLRVAANDLFDEIFYPNGIIVDGIKVSAMTASANIMVYLW